MDPDERHDDFAAGYPDVTMLWLYLESVGMSEGQLSQQLGLEPTVSPVRLTQAAIDAGLIDP